MLVNKKILSRFIWVLLGLIMLTPLYVNSDWFFPYIFSKTLAFRILVEVLFLVWLAWLYTAREKIKIDWLTIIFTVFMLTMFISSLFGPYFYFSFWSNIERSEGLLLWLHLFALFLVLRNFIVGRNQWKILINIFFASAQIVALIGLLQYFNVDFINHGAASDERVSSTIGNAAYLAGYLLFAAYFGLYLLFKHRQNIYLKAYYLAFVLMDLFVMAQTGTRGAFLALIITAFLFLVYNVIQLKNRKFKYSLLLVGVLIALSIVLVYLNKDSNFVKNSLPLQRLANISFSERTAQTRLMAWNAAWQGFLDRPLLGWGNENYYIVFNRYFDPEIYSHAGSRVWFDRAHNIFLDHLVNGGIIGFIAYLFFLFGPIWILFKRGVWSNSLWSKFRKKLPIGAPVKMNFGNQMLLLSTLAFVIQGLLVFEALVTYLPLLIIWAMIGEKYFKTKWEIGSRNIFLWTTVVYLLALFPIMYYVNYREAKASGAVIEALRLENADYAASKEITSNNYIKAIETYYQAINYNSSGTNEYRRRLAEYVDGLVVGRNITPYEALKYVEELDKELYKRLEENPYDAANLILLMRHYNYTYILNYNRLYEVAKIGELLKALSPTRPQLYHELGYADLYLYQHFRDAGDTVQAEKYQKSLLDNFQYAIDLNNDVVESYVNMIMSLIASDQPDKVQGYLDIMDQMQLNYYREDYLNRMVNSAINAKDYFWMEKLLNVLIEKYPENPNYLIRLAVAYASQDKDDLAISTAERVKSFGAQYNSQVDEFVRQVRAGTFQIE